MSCKGPCKNKVVLEILVFQDGEFQQLVPSKCEEIKKKCKYSFQFLEIQHEKG